MPYYYNVNGNVTYASHATPSTEDNWLGLRQATRGFKLISLRAAGKAAAATVLTAINHRVKRWTTAGSGGTSITPAPTMRDAPAAATTCTDKQSAITPGTTSGALQPAKCTHGLAGEGAWVARDDEEKVTVEGGSADELAVYSLCGVASQSFEGSVVIEE